MQTYWQTHKSKAVKLAADSLKFFFELDLSLGDRMLVRQYVEEEIETHSRLNIAERQFHEPVLTPVKRFLINVYGIRAVSSIEEIYHGYRQHQELLDEIKSRDRQVN